MSTNHAISPDKILSDAANTLKQRGADYDGKGYAGGERSMAQTVAIFEQITGVKLTERQGWYFLISLASMRPQLEAADHSPRKFPFPPEGFRPPLRAVGSRGRNECEHARLHPARARKNVRFVKELRSASAPRLPDHQRTSREHTARKIKQSSVPAPPECRSSPGSPPGA